MEKKQKTNFYSNIKGKYNPELDKYKDTLFPKKHAKAEQQLKKIGGGDLDEALKKIEDAFEKANKQKSK
jgi:hypothetical protein